MRMTKKYLYLILVLLIFPRIVFAASLKLDPSSGAFTVGSVFDVSLLIDTEGKSINAIQSTLSFPSDKLQLISPFTGQSIIGVWTDYPSFSNATGKINLEGGIPGGINASRGLVTTFTFRVRGVGSAALKFDPSSKVFLNDGLATDALNKVQNGIYELVLPPPAGPIVASETHPDQSRWYNNPNLILRWTNDGLVEAYSYILNADPIGVPDNIPEANENGVVYKNLADGTYYFHIKSFSQGVWGGTTHFAVNIDNASPAEFPIQITPNTRTTSRLPVIQAITTDETSGLDHYELKIISLNSPDLNTSDSEQFFMEMQNPYVSPELSLGDYQVIVRAYDRAGNYRETSQKMAIVPAIFRYIGGAGLEIRNLFIIPWWFIWLAFILLIAVLIGAAIIVKKRHLLHDLHLAKKELPVYLKEQLEELKRYRNKYGRIVLLLLSLGTSLCLVHSALAETREIPPPFITIVSRDVSNQEIFYIGGKTEIVEGEVSIYLQNLDSGETTSYLVSADKQGNWFYRHNNFLSSGDYLLWTQTHLGDLASPPSPQVQMTVRKAALQIGVSRLSYASLYLILGLILFFLAAGLFYYILKQNVQIKKKRKILDKEVREAEESLRRGFAVLRRDIEAELALIKKVKLSQALTLEEEEKEKQLLKDLDSIQRYIGKEIWDIEKEGMIG